MFKRTLILTVIIVVVASVAVVRIAKLRGRGPHSIASERAPKANVAVAISDLQPDELIAATNAPPAPEFAKGDWINSDPLTLNKLRGRVAMVEFCTFASYTCPNTLPSANNWDP